MKRRQNTPEKLAAAKALLCACGWSDRAPLTFVLTVAMKVDSCELDATLFAWCQEFAEDRKGIVEPKLRDAFAEFVRVYGKPDKKGSL